MRGREVEKGLVKRKSVRVRFVSGIGELQGKGGLRCGKSDGGLRGREEGGIGKEKA